MTIPTPKLDRLNTSVSPLAGDGVYTGEWVDVQAYTTVTVSALADVAGTLYLEFSNNNSQASADSSLPYVVSAGINEVHSLKRTRQFYRTRYVNGSDAQTSFEVSTFYENGTSLTAPLNLTLSQDADASVVRTISDEQDIAEGRRSGYQIINKFGRNPDIDTAAGEDIWEGGGFYTGFPTGAAETVEVFSSSANDAAAGSGARTIEMIGLDADYLPATEIVTLNGTTPVVTTSLWSRVFRLKVKSSGSSNTAFNAGTITVRHSTTTANVFCLMPVGVNQTQIACYTVAAGCTGYLKNLDVEMSRANNAVAKGAIWIRDFGLSPRLVRQFTITQNQALNKVIYGGIKLLEKTDVALRITETSTNGTDVTGYFDLVLVKN